MQSNVVLRFSAIAMIAFGILDASNATADKPAANRTAGGANAAPQTALPIAQGIYIADYSGSCAKATEVLAYDGSTIGYIQQALPGNRMNSPRDASFDAHPIRRTGAAARGSKEFQADLVGFTRIWFADDFLSDAGYPTEARGIKPTADGAFVMREGSMSARQMEYSDTTYRKCSFSQLSPAMQATVRRYRPLLATGAQPATPGNAALGKPANSAIAARIPLAVGYYAYVEGTFSTCAKPVGNPWYFDGTRFWEDTDFTDPKHQFSPEALKWEMVGANRFRITYRSRDEDGRWEPKNSVNEYVITGPQSFTYVGWVGGQMNANEKRQLCAASQLPAKARWFKGAR